MLGLYELPELPGLFTFTYFFTLLQGRASVLYQTANMPKRNPQKSHHEWLEIHLTTIGRLVQIEKEKEEALRENTTLQEEKEEALRKNMTLQEEKEEALRENMTLQEEKLERKIQLLKEENVSLKERVEGLEVMVDKGAKQFSTEKPQKILVCGDSHLKCIPLKRLANKTGKNIEFIKIFCSCNDLPGAWKPEISISSVLLQQVDARATNLLITSPTSDLTNLVKMSPSARIHWVDLSAKTIVNTAEMALIRFPALMSVTIMEHLPR